MIVTETRLTVRISFKSFDLVVVVVWDSSLPTFFLCVHVFRAGNHKVFQVCLMYDLRYFTSMIQAFLR